MLLLVEKVLMNSRILNDMMDLQKIAYTTSHDNAFISTSKLRKWLIAIVKTLWFNNFNFFTYIQTSFYIAN